MDDFRYKPARDQGLPAAEQMKSVQRETGLFGWCTQMAWRVAVKTYLRTYHRLEIIGAEHIPVEAPFVLVANHSSHLDALSLGSALPWRLRERAFPIAAGDVFFERPAATLFSAMLLNALPMWRRRCGPQAMKVLRERLIEEPAIYIIFPEGTRSRTGKMGEFKAGVGMLVAGTEVKVVPAHISGAWRAWAPGTSVPRPRKVRIRFGPAMSFTETPDARAGWETIGKTLQEAVSRLNPARRAHPERESAAELI